MLSLSIEKKRIGGNYDWVKIEREKDIDCEREKEARD